MVFFSAENPTNNPGRIVKGPSSLHNLDLFMDEQSIIRVCGKTRRASVDTTVKHSVTLPKTAHVNDLIVRYCHQQTPHQDRVMTMNDVRSNGYG